MNIRILTAILILFVLSNSAYSQELEWAIQIGNETSDVGKSNCIDIYGNVYVTGYFTDTVDFDPGIDIVELSSAGNRDIYVLKLDFNGNLLWVNQLGGSGYDEAFSISTDLMGNVYVTGLFSDSVDFDPGSGIEEMISAGLTDVFIQKLNGAGNLEWARSMGGAYHEIGVSITVDPNGDVITAGHFYASLNFDPGVTETSLESTGGYDIYLTKHASNGDFLWANHMGGEGNDGAFSVVTDMSSNIYLTGNFQFEADFDPTAGTLELISNGGEDYFLQKFDTNGNSSWVKQVGGIGDDIPKDISLDSDGNIHITGYFEDTVDFNTGPDTFNLVSEGDEDIFIQKLNSSGEFIWARQMGGTDFDSGTSLAIDTDGNVYCVGVFRDSVDFDPGSGSYTLVSEGSNDIYVQKLNSSGELDWVVNIGGTEGESGLSIAIDSSDNLYTTGWFSGSLDFDFGIGTTEFTSAGAGDIFVQKISSGTTGISEIAIASHTHVYPNPTNGRLSIELGRIHENATISLSNLYGQIIWTEKFPRLSALEMEIVEPNGSYLLILESENRREIIKLIKM